MIHEKLFLYFGIWLSPSLRSDATCKIYDQKLTLNIRLLFHLLWCEQQQEQDPTNLYISNLPLSVDEKELENMLQPFGQVVSTRILRDYSGNSRGVGFARSVKDDWEKGAFTSFLLNQLENSCRTNLLFWSQSCDDKWWTTVKLCFSVTLCSYCLNTVIDEPKCNNFY